MEISDTEKRRAENLIWNAAGDYSFQPDFRVFDAEGRADLYWNSVIGAVRRRYDWKKLSALFQNFRGRLNQLEYENLTWLALENAVFPMEQGVRSALPFLRTVCARRIAAVPPVEGESVANRLLRAHFQRVLGQSPVLAPEETALLDALEGDNCGDADQFAARTLALFTEYLAYRPAGERAEDDGAERQSFRLPFLRIGWRSKNAPAELPPVRGFGFGFGEHADEYGGSESMDQSHIHVRFAKYAAQTDEGLRKYIESYFGAPLYGSRELRELERTLCTGNHRDCHLHFTRGEDGPAPLEGFVAKQRQAAREQADRNRAYYQAHLDSNRTAIDRLTARLKNSMLTQLESSMVKSGAGRLVGSRVWRGLYLNDPKIFEKELRGDPGNLSVDILLDASTSQIHRQELVSTQGYLIAESLTRCHLPVRVYSFCSMSGYTIVRLFRDYRETEKNDAIFSYFTTGCNRDGLAVRVSAELLKKTDAEHKLLIVLSDAKPNDVLKVQTSLNIWRDYTESVGVEDAAMEVHRARVDGVSVICVFTGGDDDLPSVRRIYGRDFARIRSLDQFADTVGALIQNQIRNL
jgi:hypothetical protein